MKEQKGLILDIKSKMAKYLNALVTCYDIGSVMETLSIDKIISK
jgi:translation initiation factor 2 beta subunit (eIF-2beta)/eIF-5